MDLLQGSQLDGHPPLETAGSTSAVGADGYVAIKQMYF